MHWSEERPWALDTITGPSVAFQLNPHDQEVACSGPLRSKRPVNSEEINVVIYKVQCAHMQLAALTAHLLFIEFFFFYLQ